MTRKALSSLIAVLALASATSLVACGGQDAGAGDEQNVTQVTKGRFEIFVGDDGQFYFRVVANNNEKLLRSEGYTTRASAEKGIAATKVSGTDPKNYRLAQAEDGQWFFDLVAKNGEIIGTSETYASNKNAQRGATTLQKVIATLKSDDVKKPRVLCSLKRLAEVPQGVAQVDVDMATVSEEEPAISDALQAFDGSYNFDVLMDAESIIATFYESKHVEDEVGQISCDVPKLERGVTFCEEPIEADASLGTDNKEKMVHAFDFFCHVE